MQPDHAEQDFFSIGSAGGSDLLISGKQGRQVLTEPIELLSFSSTAFATVWHIKPDVIPLKHSSFLYHGFQWLHHTCVIIQHLAVS